MYDSLQSIRDTNPAHPTINSGRQVASDGSFLSTDEAELLALLDFSRMGLNNHGEHTTLNNATCISLLGGWSINSSSSSATGSGNTTTGLIDNGALFSVKCCGKDFHDESTMRRHRLTMHNTHKRNKRDGPKCPGCNRTFSRIDSLGRHLNRTEMWSRCRTAAMKSGWVEVIRNGDLRLSHPRGG